MSTVRVPAGTRKGALVLRSDGKRKRWQIDGPYFGGREIYYMAGEEAFITVGAIAGG